MNDIKANMAPGGKAEGGKQKVEMAVGGEGKAPFSTQPACGGEGAATMRMPEIDVRELSDEMLMFMLQLMAPEKYGKAALWGKDESRKLKAEIAAQQRADIRSQRSEEMPETSESGSGFIPQAAGGELVMSQNCPEMGEGKAESGKQKVEMAEMSELPESRCGFAMPQRGRSSDAAPMGLVLLGWISINMPALWASKTVPSLEVWPILSRTPMDRCGSAEIPESKCDFILHEADAEWLMPRVCPEMGRGRGELSRRCQSARGGHDREKKTWAEKWGAGK
jgi:hypothetical protein